MRIYLPFSHNFPRHDTSAKKVMLALPSLSAPSDQDNIVKLVASSNILIILIISTIERGGERGRFPRKMLCISC